MSEIATPKKLTPGQHKAIESLLTTGNTTEAATTAGVNRSTLYRWLHDETFVAALRAAEQQAVANLSRNLVGLGDAAAAAFRDALNVGQGIPVRLKAAALVTDRLLRIRELVELEARISELERLAKEKDNENDE